LLIQSWRRKAPTASNAELTSHTRLLAIIATSDNYLLFALVFLFPFMQKAALSSSTSNVNSLVFCLWEPCGCSTSDCAILLHSGAQSAWHNERNVPIYASAERCPLLSSSVGSLKHCAEGERNSGRDALSNPSGRRVVAKANEADCGAQTPKSNT